ncbi:D-lactate dehydrogenase (cytochrome) [Bacillus ectoiniformans]|uniref:FAD-binding oxidoreductase n=1 Tax=Bacillus ectoiniformans TaxID=1494429 RepID=UPI00195DDBE5|nr:FAD-linked oxidase C-terminal domain-containing protein [Bacillus ectoiniformans]MBM7649426.1 D-lactate dehydrogenase (cytochrome) [Bacillus ectoiniformans]
MDLFKKLITVLSSDQVTVNPTILEHHSKDESHFSAHLPDVVVFPQSAADVQKIVTFASEHQVPVVPFGAGSGLEGHAIPVQGGISIDFERMNQIIELRPEDLIVKVQPGITRMQLNQELKKHGLFFPVDPGADASIGGMASTNASGTQAVRYGVMRDQILDLEVVLADGRVIHTGSLAKKSSSGYHLNGLFVGSEGTLGVFTEITLKLHGIPESIVAARACFPSVKDCVETAVSILTAGIPIARMELVDARSIMQVNQYSGTDFYEVPSLFLEFHGNEEGNTADALFVEAICSEHNCTEFIFEKDSLKRAQLWKARHDLSYSFRHADPKKEIIGTDVCVPISKLADIVEYARERIHFYGLDGAVLGHIGDGNFHTLVVYDPENAEDVQKITDLNGEIVDFAFTLGGSCTGEHGVGMGKMKYQRQEHGEALDVMISMKQLFDPKNILNPGKLIPMKQESALTRE